MHQAKQSTSIFQRINSRQKSLWLNVRRRSQKFNELSETAALVDDALEVVQSLKTRVTTAQLNKVLWRALAEHPPAADRGKPVKIKYATQAETMPPTIVIFCNHPDAVHFSYVRYLENRIRAAYPFRGVPLRIQLRKSGKDER